MWAILALSVAGFFSAGQPEPMAGRFFVGNTNAAQKDRPLVGVLDD